MKSGRHPDFPQYLIFEDGTVISYARKTPRKMTPKDICRGYLGLRIVNADGKLQSIKHHRLVCAVFHGPCPDGHETRHLDGNRSNNCASNLRWGTPKENAEDQARHGTRRGNEILTPEMVLRMREIRRTTGITFAALAAMFNMSESGCHDAVTGVNWPNI